MGSILVPTLSLYAMARISTLTVIAPKNPMSMVTYFHELLNPGFLCYLDFYTLV